MYLAVAVRILERKNSHRRTMCVLFFLLVVLTDFMIWSVEKLGKRKVINEGELENITVPTANDVLGIAVRMLGFDRILVKCQDGKERLCRVRGKLKRRVWIREGDIVLVSPWDFQSDKRGDIFWRYRKNQAEWLRSNGYLTM